MSDDEWCKHTWAHVRWVNEEMRIARQQCTACDALRNHVESGSTREEVRDTVIGQADSLRTFLAAEHIATGIGRLPTGEDQQAERRTIAHRLLSDRANLLRVWGGHRELEPYEAEILKTMQRAAELLGGGK